MRRSRIFAVAYVAIGILTFGYSAAHAQAMNDAEYEQCRAATSLCFRDDVSAPMGALLATVGWPLYWSWEAWS